jgi:hypothetical protein
MHDLQRAWLGKTLGQAAWSANNDVAPMKIPRILRPQYLLLVQAALNLYSARAHVGEHVGTTPWNSRIYASSKQPINQHGDLHSKLTVRHHNHGLRPF